jgi:RNA polymerase sigma-70 factor, ECF subfamily
LAEGQHDLVIRARDGDATAFATLIEHHERAALAVAYALSGDGASAGDAVQEAFWRAWRQLGTLKDPGRFGPWLLQIVRHAALDVRRRKRPTVATVPEQTAERPEPPEAAAKAEQAIVIRRAIDTLDEVTRSVVLLRYYEDLSTQQIAELMELSPGAVDMRLTRGRGELRQKLGRLLDETGVHAT